jgi:carbon-monoxide dehydrogenase medium subunit
VELARAGGPRRRVAVEDFLVDQFATALEPGELLVGVHVPPLAPGTRATYVKFLPRTEDDYATISVAAAVRVADGRIADARVALGSVGATAVRARRTEEALRGAAAEAIADAAALVRDEIDPIDDLRGSAAYKREMAAVWTERAVRSLVA